MIKYKQILVRPIHNFSNNSKLLRVVIDNKTSKIVNDINYLSVQEKNELLNSSREIISKGVDINNNDKQRIVGLIIGHVQSGKTSSFTTVTSLAHENNYPIVIVITGNSQLLSIQSEERINRELKIKEQSIDIKWHLFSNPSIKKRNINDIKSILENIESIEDYNSSIIFTVMKNHIHINNLIKVLINLPIKNKPVLVIDDEADQASLNNKPDKELDEASTTYKNIIKLFNILNRVYYLQYTATPQANLLINIQDILSPDFCKILKPGEKYIGGKEFFITNTDFVIPIPDDEIPDKYYRLKSPTESLKKALALFFIGVVVGKMRQDVDIAKKRSMLIHPSREKVAHGDYVIMVEEIKSYWYDILSRAKFQHKSIRKYFNYAYNELDKTVENLPPLDIIFTKLAENINSTRIMEINTRNGKTPTVDWYKSYSWILIGGQALERGYTIEGLTVTYLPRNDKTINADTLEQRGRFFGYKKEYLGFCRLFLKQYTLEAFTEYAKHEDFMHKTLIKLVNSNIPLKQWKRLFYLSPQMNMCRSSIISSKIIRGDYKNKWFVQKYFPSKQIGKYNLSLIKDLHSYFNFNETKFFEDSERNIHKSNNLLKLSTVIDKFLSKYKIGHSFSEIDSYSGLMFQLQKFIEKNEDELCCIYNMNFNKYGYRGKNKSNNDQITELFGGPPSKNNNKFNGDRNLKEKNILTIQIHQFSRDRKKEKDPYSMLGIWVPAKFSNNWIVQSKKQWKI